jgi:exopolyphosphatase/pppGpp-phosphohydrolase
VFASLVDLFDIPRLRISSGGLREGVVLRELRVGMQKSYDAELVGAA